MQGFCKSCGRAYLVTLNVMFCLLGVVIASAGIYATVKADTLEKDAPLLAALDIDRLAIVLTAVGSLLTILSILGMCGAMNKNAKILMCYAGSTFFLVLVQMGLAIALILIVNGSLDNAIEKDWNSASPKRINEVQELLECCGYETTTDTLDRVDCPNDYPTPCHDAIVDWLDSIMRPFAITCFVLSLLELMGLSVACVLANRARRSKTMRKELFGLGFDDDMIPASGEVEGVEGGADKVPERFLLDAEEGNLASDYELSRLSLSRQPSASISRQHSLSRADSMRSQVNVAHRELIREPSSRSSRGY